MTPKARVDEVVERLRAALARSGVSCRVVARWDGADVVIGAEGAAREYGSGDTKADPYVMRAVAEAVR